MKVVIGTRVGGFGLPIELAKILAKDDPAVKEELDIVLEMIEEGTDAGWFNHINIRHTGRSHPTLIDLVTQNPESCKHLTIVDIPDHIKYTIWEGDDGSESIHEDHRIWT